MRTYILFITLLCTLSLKAQIVDCTPSKPTGDESPFRCRVVIIRIPSHVSFIIGNAITSGVIFR